MDRPHPGFGLFAKVHREFFDALAADGWRDIAGYQGVSEKILSGHLDHTARIGAATRLARWQPGAAVAHTVVHEWCEEVFVVEGTLSIGRRGETVEAVLPKGSYACRPPHIVHGPFFSDDGCLLLEVMYYPVADRDGSPRSFARETTA